MPLHGGKASMAAAWLRLPASIARRPRINSTNSNVAAGLRVVGAHQHIGFQPRFQVLHFQRRQMIKGSDHQ
jgi:hypothetical protein